MVAQVVPIRREDYYYGVADENGIELVDPNENRRDDNKTPKSLSSRRNNIERESTHGNKRLRDRHSNVVLCTINIYSN